jgi:hypothetical protein
MAGMIVCHFDQFTSEFQMSIPLRVQNNLESLSPFDHRTLTAQSKITEFCFQICSLFLQQWHNLTLPTIHQELVSSPLLR